MLTSLVCLLEQWMNAYLLHVDIKMDKSAHILHNVYFKCICKVRLVKPACTILLALYHILMPCQFSFHSNINICLLLTEDCYQAPLIY